MKGCVKLENAPDVHKEVLEKQKVTMEEIHEALFAIEKRRIEDNKSNFMKFLNRIFKREGGDE